MNRIISISVLLLSPFSMAQNVELALEHKLDGFLSNYCIDMVGMGSTATTDQSLQAHTCYSYRGELGVDQAFDSTKFTDNQLYLPNFNICAEFSDLSIGATLNLNKCSNNQLQKIEFTNEGLIRPLSNRELCLTSGLTTKRGRNRTSDHQIKTLTLQRCESLRENFQTWHARVAN